MSSTIRQASHSIAPAKTPLEVKPAGVQVGILDRDRWFVESLSLTMAEQGWRLLYLPTHPAPADLPALGLKALLLDVARVTESALAALIEAAISPKVAIVACTEESTVAERVRGLEAGLDGWIEKPCQPPEVLARIQAILRTRHAGLLVRQSLRSGELEVRSDRFDAVVNGMSAGLTTREFELLELLVRHEGVVLAREQIYQAVWGYEMLAGDRVVDVFVGRVRRKLEGVSPGWRYLHTHPGHGYKFAVEAAERAAVEEFEHSATSGETERLQRDGGLALV
jgi:DNA-binding response OmpR family regulator